MKNILKLTYGEITRLIKYMILPISLVTAVIWILIFLFVSADEAKTLAPIAIFVDVSMMSVILIGASHHLEKQEGVIKSMLMMPVNIHEILISKVISSMILAFESAVVVALSLYLIHGIVFDYHILFIFIVIASAAHAAIGFSLSLISFDFSTMLGYLFGYMFIFTVPSLLKVFEIISDKYEWILFISPAHSSSVLISSAVYGEYDAAKIVYSIIFLVLVSAVLFKFVVLSLFRSHSVRS